MSQSQAIAGLHGIHDFVLLGQEHSLALLLPLQQSRQVAGRAVPHQFVRELALLDVVTKVGRQVGPGLDGGKVSSGAF